MKKMVTTLTARKRYFVIVQDGNMYCAIEDKYIDAEGKLKQALNGLQMHASESLDRCIQQTRDSVEMDWLEAHGASKAEAFAKVTGTPLEICEKLFK